MYNLSAFVLTREAGRDNFLQKIDKISKIKEKQQNEKATMVIFLLVFIILPCRKKLYRLSKIVIQVKDSCFWKC